MPSNDTAGQQSEFTNKDFEQLFNFLKTCGKSVFIYGPIPTLGRRVGYLGSRILSLNSCFICCPIITHTFYSFEATMVKICSSTQFLGLVIYHTPYDRVVIVGDFNIHIDDPTNGFATEF